MSPFLISFFWYICSCLGQLIRMQLYLVGGELCSIKIPITTFNKFLTSKKNWGSYAPVQSNTKRKDYDFVYKSQQALSELNWCDRKVTFRLQVKMRLQFKILLSTYYAFVLILSTTMQQ